MSRISDDRLMAAAAVITALAAAALFLFVPPITQDQSYHAFADGRTIFGIRNFWNVVSNLPFAVAGVVGLWKTRGAGAKVLFAGVLMTCFGSAYYHLDPNDARLVWDRLPMTVVFMAFLFLVLTESRERRVAYLALMLAAGVASVVWWRITGDLRPYAVVQFGPAILLVAASRNPAVRRRVLPVAGFYVLAKFAEHYDAAIFQVLPVSGHTLKHLAGALACWFMLDFKQQQIQAERDAHGLGGPRLHGAIN